jgi:D-galactose 1-dehydrogenase
MLELADGTRLRLTKGGASVEVDGRLLADEQPAEYEAIYEHFAKLLRAGESHVEGAPLELVADAFMLGRRILVEPFEA